MCVAKRGVVYCIVVCGVWCGAVCVCDTLVRHSGVVVCGVVVIMVWCNLDFRFIIASFSCLVPPAFPHMMSHRLLCDTYMTNPDTWLRTHLSRPRTTHTVFAQSYPFVHSFPQLTHTHLTLTSLTRRPTQTLPLTLTLSHNPTQVLSKSYPDIPLTSVQSSFRWCTTSPGEATPHTPHHMDHNTPPHHIHHAHHTT